MRKAGCGSAALPDSKKVAGCADFEFIHYHNGGCQKKQYPHLRLDMDKVRKTYLDANLIAREEYDSNKKRINYDTSHTWELPQALQYR